MFSTTQHGFLRNSQPTPGQARWSDYSTVVDLPLDGETDHLLVHGYSGAFDLVSAQTLGQLKSLTAQGASWALLKESLGEEQITLLQRRGYLTDRSPHEEQAFFVRYAERFHEYARTSAPSYLIVPSYECNLRCHYCFQADPGTRNAQAAAGFKPVSKEAVEAILAGIQVIEKEIGQKARRKRRTVMFYGGEPLLAKHRALVERCLGELRFEGGTEFRAISNGTDLQAYDGLLGPSGIAEIQVTLDGPAHHHDRRRVAAGGGGTFHRISENISFALRQDVRINLRVNVDRQNLQSLPELARDIRTQGWAGFPGFYAYLAPVHSNKKATNGEKIFDTAPFHAEIEALGQAFPEMEVFHFPDSGLRSQILRVIQHGADPTQFAFKPVSCGAHAGMFIFDFQGGIYACTERTNAPSERIGQIQADGQVRFHQHRMDAWRSRSVATLERCRACAYALFCGGGCAIDFDGDANCDDFPARFHRAAASAWREFSKGGTADSREAVSC